MDESILRITPHLLIPLSEISFRTSRSSGPGGQNVNKLETKVEILFDVGRSASLSPAQRNMILDDLSGRIDSTGVLRITVQQSRSQYQNKELAVQRLVDLIRKALHPRKHRIATKPTRKAKARRMDSKRRMSEKKKLRKSFPE